MAGEVGGWGAGAGGLAGCGGLAAGPEKSGQERRTEGSLLGPREEEGVTLKPKSRSMGLGRARALSSRSWVRGVSVGTDMRYRCDHDTRSTSEKWAW